MPDQIQVTDDGISTAHSFWRSLPAIHLRRQEGLEAARRASTGAGGDFWLYLRPSYAPQPPATQILSAGELQEPQKWKSAERSRSLLCTTKPLAAECVECFGP